MKKLLAMLFLGALVSLGCNQGKTTTKATEKETKTGGMGSGAMTTPAARSTGAAPATGAAHSKETQAGGKSTKTGETKK